MPFNRSASMCTHTSDMLKAFSINFLSQWFNWKRASLFFELYEYGRMLSSLITLISTTLLGGLKVPRWCWCSLSVPGLSLPQWLWHCVTQEQGRIPRPTWNLFHSIAAALKVWPLKLTAQKAQFSHSYSPIKLISSQQVDFLLFS